MTDRTNRLALAAAEALHALAEVLTDWAGDGLPARHAANEAPSCATCWPPSIAAMPDLTTPLNAGVARRIADQCDSPPTLRSPWRCQPSNGRGSSASRMRD